MGLAYYYFREILFSFGHCVVCRSIQLTYSDYSLGTFKLFFCLLHNNENIVTANEIRKPDNVLNQMQNFI